MIVVLMPRLLLKVDKNNWMQGRLVETDKLKEPASKRAILAILKRYKVQVILNNVALYRLRFLNL